VALWNFDQNRAAATGAATAGVSALAASSTVSAIRPHSRSPISAQSDRAGDVRIGSGDPDPLAGLRTRRRTELCPTSTRREQPATTPWRQKRNGLLRCARKLSHSGIGFSSVRQRTPQESKTWIDQIEKNAPVAVPSRGSGDDHCGAEDVQNIAVDFASPHTRDAASEKARDEPTGPRRIVQSAGADGA